MSNRKSEIDLGFAQFPAPAPVNLGLAALYSIQVPSNVSSNAIRYFNKISETLCKYDSEKRIFVILPREYSDFSDQQA